MAEQCKEFNSLKYRTLISTGTNIESTVDTSEEAINNFLNEDGVRDSERNSNYLNTGIEYFISIN